MSMWTQHITYKCAESLHSIASNLCKTKENLLSEEEHSNSCASMYTFLHNFPKRCKARARMSSTAIKTLIPSVLRGAEHSDASSIQMKRGAFFSD